MIDYYVHVQSLPTKLSIKKKLSHNTMLCNTLHRVCPKSDQRTVVSMTRYVDCDLADLIPQTVESVQHFADLVYAIKNPAFGLPTAMMYGTFRYVLKDMAVLTGSTSLLYLDPEVSVSIEERYAELSKVDQHSLLWCSNLIVHTIGTSAQQVMQLPIGPTLAHTESDHLSFEHPVHVEIELRRHYVTQIASEQERLQVLRVIAAESEDLAPRTRLLLSDLAIPLLIVNGCNTAECVQAVAFAVELGRRYNMGVVHLS